MREVGFLPKCLQTWLDSPETRPRQIHSREMKLCPLFFQSKFHFWSQNWLCPRMTDPGKPALIRTSSTEQPCWNMASLHPGDSTQKVERVGAWGSRRGYFFIALVSKLLRKIDSCFSFFKFHKFWAFSLELITYRNILCSFSEIDSWISCPKSQGLRAWPPPRSYSIQDSRPSSIRTNSSLQASKSILGKKLCFFF